MFNIEDYREYITPETAIAMVADLVVALDNEVADGEIDKVLTDEIEAFYDIAVDNLGEAQVFYSVGKRLIEVDASTAALRWWGETYGVTE